MSDRYVTTHQYEPLRAPSNWNNEERKLIRQLTDIFDDIYRRYGRLRLEDLSKSVRDSFSGMQTAIEQSADEIVLLASSKNRTYRQPEEPTGTAEIPLVAGDLWIDDNNKLYRYNGEEWTDAQDAAISDLQGELDNFEEAVTATVEGLQAQIDGQIMTWFYAGEPTMLNAPASEWTTDDIKTAHLGDLYYDTATGYAYRFALEGGVFTWLRIVDTDVTAALANAQRAQDTADGKRRVFVATPEPPYDVGDLWSGGADGELLRCNNKKNSGQAYSASDWGPVSDISNRLDTAEAAIIVNTDGITQKVSKNSVISEINQSAEQVKIKAEKIEFEGTVTANEYFKINTDGSMEASAGKIGGFAIDETKLTGPGVELDWGGEYAPGIVKTHEMVMKPSPLTGRSAIYTRARFILQCTEGLTGPYIEFDNGTIFLSSQPVVSSDAKLKTDVRDIGPALDIIRKLLPKKYRYKTDEPERNDSLGFIAQDVQKVLPELVHTTTGGTLALDYIGLIPVLVRGMQEILELLQRDAKGSGSPYGLFAESESAPEHATETSGDPGRGSRED